MPIVVKCKAVQDKVKVTASQIMWHQERQHKKTNFKPVYTLGKLEDFEVSL